MNEDAAAFKGRQFICACGKNYLSYAALFTHIKQKHDGQPPGPITRPRSERKRGRPRKNPQGDNQISQSESDKAQNVMQKIQDNHIQKQQDHEKTKKAAQLLGCGGFVAFTAYRPEPIRSSPKKGFQSARKSLSRKGSSYNQLVQRKISNSLIPYHQQGDHITNAQQTTQQPQIISKNLCKKLQNINKNELIKIFTNHPQNSQNWPLKSQQLQIFKKINVNYQNPQQITNIQQVSINVGMALFLNQIKQLLNNKQKKQQQKNNNNNIINTNTNININTNTNININKQKIKIEQSQNNQQQDQNQVQNWNITQKQKQKQKYDEYQFDQVLLLVAFLLKYIVQLGPDGINQLQAKPIFQIVQYLPKFTTQYIHEQIKLYQLQNFDIFKIFNPIKFIIYLNNWLTIKKNITEIYNKNSQIHHSVLNINLHQIQNNNNNNSNINNNSNNKQGNGQNNLKQQQSIDQEQQNQQNINNSNQMGNKQQLINSPVKIEQIVQSNNNSNNNNNNNNKNIDENNKKQQTNSIINKNKKQIKKKEDQDYQQQLQLEDQDQSYK